MKRVLQGLLGASMALSLMGCVVDPYGNSAYDYDSGVGTTSLYYDTNDYYYPGYYSPTYYYGLSGYGWGGDHRYGSGHGHGWGHGGGHGGWGGGHHGGHGGHH